MKHFKSLTKTKEARVDEIGEVGAPREGEEAGKAEKSVGYQTEGNHNET